MLIKTITYLPPVEGELDTSLEDYVAEYFRTARTSYPPGSGTVLPMIETTLEGPDGPIAVRIAISITVSY